MSKNHPHTLNEAILFKQMVEMFWLPLREGAKNYFGPRIQDLKKISRSKYVKGFFQSKMDFFKIQWTF